jgi:hypothetical protein
VTDQRISISWRLRGSGDPAVEKGELSPVRLADVDVDALFLKKPKLVIQTLADLFNLLGGPYRYLLHGRFTPLGRLIDSAFTKLWAICRTSI